MQSSTIHQHSKWAALAFLLTPAWAMAEMVEDVETIMDEPAEYVGMQVSVPGAVDEVYDNRSFLLEGGGTVDDEIIVVTTSDQSINPEDDVTVTGTVTAATVIDIERDIGWDFDPGLEVEFEDVQYYIIADEVVPGE